MTGLEYVWAASTILGALVSILGIVESQRDRRAIRAIVRNGRHLTADHALVRFVMRLLIRFAWLGALFVGREWAAVLLILANLALTVSDGSELYVGAALRRFYRRES